MKVKEKAEEVSKTCDFTVGPRACWRISVKNLEELCDIRRMISS